MDRWLEEFVQLFDEEGNLLSDYDATTEEEVSGGDEPQVAGGAGDAPMPPRRPSRKRKRQPNQHQRNIKAKNYNVGERRVDGEDTRARRPGGKYNNHDSLSRTVLIKLIILVCYALFLLTELHCALGRCECRRLKCHENFSAEDQTAICSRFWSRQSDRVKRYSFIDRNVTGSLPTRRRPRQEVPRERALCYQYRLGKLGQIPIKVSFHSSMT